MVANRSAEALGPSQLRDSVDFALDARNRVFDLLDRRAQCEAHGGGLQRKCSFRAESDR